MWTVLDVENTTTPGEKRDDVSPFNPNNKLVSVGWCSIEGSDLDSYAVGAVEYAFFFHSELPKDYPVGEKRDALQAQLDKTTLLIFHNGKHDLEWLVESGFNYNGPVYDTKIGEYVLLRGVKRSTELDDVAKRRGCTRKKSDLVAELFKKKITIDKHPIGVVEEYGRGDIVTTAEVFISQLHSYAEEKNVGLKPTRDMSNSFCRVLVDMECNGIAIDRKALEDVKVEYQEEKAKLVKRMYELVFEVMGDTPVNLDSPEQLSSVIYSRRMIDKDDWHRTFNIGLDERGKKKRRPWMSVREFVSTVSNKTYPMRRTKAHACPACKGDKLVYKKKKDGTNYKKPNRCKECGGSGLKYENLTTVAGFKLTPEGVADCAAGGFATDKVAVAKLLVQARKKGNDKAIEFLTAMSRLNAVSTYLNSFVGGIERGVQDNGILHPKFNQTITSTGRLSSSDPNYQNQPRGGTFPVRRVVVSRFTGGCIMEADYAQLEFRCAGILAGCPNVANDIANGVDAHQFTADTMTQAGQPTSRQQAKPHTFKPLYGGLSGTEAEQTYYQAFLNERYPRILEWHNELLETAVKTKMVTLPTGRQYHLPAERTRSGWITFSTQIKNYPVQGFATADIVPIANIRLWNSLRNSKMKSLLINTVHDSIVVDVYPGEEQAVCNMLIDAMLGVTHYLKKKHNIVLSIPLAVEVKSGPNWLDTKVIATGDTEGKRDYTAVFSAYSHS